MRHDYYDYNRKELLRNPKIPIIVRNSNDDIFKEISDEMIQEIVKNNENNKNTVFICPVGPTGQYPYFVETVNRNKISLKNVWFINMDEYLDENKQWLPKDHRLSFRGYMDRGVYLKINQELVMRKEQRVFPDPNHPAYISGLIKELGGVDIVFGGIGINGHVAFNEPQEELTGEEFLRLQTRVRSIAQETRAINSVGDLNGAIEDMPQYCVTVGMNEILHAGKIRLGCFRDWHRAVVRRAAYGDETSNFPVSLLRRHPDINLRISEFVAELG